MATTASDEYMGSSLPPSSSHRSVTTFVAQQPLFGDEDDPDRAYTGKRALTHSLRLLGLKPNHSHSQAALTFLSSWDGRDALLQLVQSVTLLTYALAPIRRKQLHIASESVANSRRLIVLGRLLSHGSEALQGMWQSSKRAHDNQHGHGEDSSSSSDSDDEMAENYMQDDARRVSREEKRAIGGNHASAVRSWQRTWESRLEAAAEYLTLAGEGCEVIALLGGSSIIWRVVGGKLAARQRKGLERLALFFLFFAFLTTLRHLQMTMRRRIHKLRRGNGRLLAATDRVEAEADASLLLQARRLSTEEALTLHRRKELNGKMSALPALRDNDASQNEKGSIERFDAVGTALRKAEAKLFLQRKKMQLLRLERTAIRSELLFITAELLWPHHDHARLEGWTGLIASLCRMSRLTKESRWQ